LIGEHVEMTGDVRYEQNKLIQKRFGIMKKLFLALIVGSLPFAVADPASAQTEGAILGGTLTTGAAVGLGAALIVLGIAVGGSDGVTTTTTTP
jgi:hypothetical protein